MSNKWGGKNYNYREEYFKRNKGFFGIYKCPYCLFGFMTKKTAHVDHIVPKSKAFGANAYYNTIASCRRCNLKKSNKINHMILQGYSAKVIQETLRAGKGAITMGAKGSFTLIGFLLNIVRMVIAPIVGLILFILRRIWWIVILLLLFWLGPELRNYLL